MLFLYFFFFFLYSLLLENIIQMNEYMIDKIQYKHHCLQNTNNIINVNVQPMYSIINATTIYLEPMSTKDWEYVEIFANQLEAGLLLNQISIIYINQILPLRIGSDIVYLRVLEKNFTTFQHQHHHHHRHRHHPCLRLVAESEVIITPKPRSRNRNRTRSNRQSYTPSKPFRIQPTQGDFSNDMKILCDIFDHHYHHHQYDNKPLSSSMIPCPPFLHVWMHPDTMKDELDGWDDVSLSDDITTAFVFIRKYDNNIHSSLNSVTNDDDDDTKEEHVAIAMISSSHASPLDCVGKKNNHCMVQ